MNRILLIFALIFGSGATGCVMIEVGVANPVPGLTTVAVAPFFNLSAERAADGRRFALAYFTELQKTPGFQVVPVGVTERAIQENNLEMSSVDDVLKLAKILDVDAVVVGAITDFEPYYPPRIGLQVSWYSPKLWTFYPGVAVDEYARDLATPKQVPFWKRWCQEHLWWHHNESCGLESGCECPVDQSCPQPLVTGQTPMIRGQSWDEAVSNASSNLPGSIPQAGSIRMLQAFSPVPAENSLPPFSPEILPGQLPKPQPTIGQPPSLSPNGPIPGLLPQDRGAWKTDGSIQDFDPTPSAVAPPVLRPAPASPAQPDHAKGPLRHDETFDPRQPLMSYTRIIDGADARLVAKLRDYVELNGDLRSGGWQGYLQRSEDFLRFSAHVMIVEMLQLHGGETRRRMVLAVRKHK